MTVASSRPPPSSGAARGRPHRPPRARALSFPAPEPPCCTTQRAGESWAAANDQVPFYIDLAPRQGTAACARAGAEPHIAMKRYTHSSLLACFQSSALDQTTAGAELARQLSSLAMKGDRCLYCDAATAKRRLGCSGRRIARLWPQHLDATEPSAVVATLGCHCE